MCGSLAPGLRPARMFQSAIGKHDLGGFGVGQLQSLDTYLLRRVFGSIVS